MDGQLGQSGLRNSAYDVVGFVINILFNIISEVTIPTPGSLSRPAVVRHGSKKSIYATAVAQERLEIKMRKARQRKKTKMHSK